MLSKYHISFLTETLHHKFSAAALREIIQANIWQDSPFTFLDHPQIHVDDSKFAEAQAYIEAQHAIIAQSDNPREMRAAFGRLTHGAQDFYAHSNYVTLWLEAHDHGQTIKPQDINGLDEDVLSHPRLRSGNFYLWRDIIYYIPLFNRFAKKYLVFANSHEELHLDDPSRGIKFLFACEAAKQRTLVEYRRVTQKLTIAQLARFHDTQTETSPLAIPNLRTA